MTSGDFDGVQSPLDRYVEQRSNEVRGMKTALVTGAAGFIGSHLVTELLDRGYAVTGLDDLSTGRPANLEHVEDHDDFEFVEGDVRDEDVVEATVADADYVFHQAAIPSVPKSIDDPKSTTDVNCSGTANVLSACRDAGTEGFVMASSCAVYGSTGELPKRETSPVDPESPYALSKFYGEQLALEYAEHHGLDAVPLRYFNVYGPRQDPSGPYAAVIPKFIELMLAGERPTVFGDGEQTRDFVFVEDVVQANLLAATGDVAGEVINVGAGERTSLNALVDEINAVLETEIEPIYDDPRPGDIRHSGSDASKAHELLGFEQRVDLREGIRRTVESMRD